MNGKNKHSTLKKQGMNLMRSNRLNEAKALFTQLCTSNPEDAESWYVLSSINGMLGHIDEAGDCCRKVIALQPNHGEAHCNLGNVLSYQGKHDEAIAHYQRALQINPNNPVAHNNLGNACKNSGRLDQAVESYKRAIAIKPDYAVAHYNLGSTLKEQNHLEEAKDSFRRAITLNPNYAEAYNNLGLTLKEQGKPADAAAAIERALKLKPGFAEAHYNLGNINYSQGHIEKAVEKYRQAVLIKPDYADAYGNLGSALKEQGHIDDAAECYRRAIALKPDSPTAYNNLALVFRMQGALEAADEMAQHALKLQPDHVDTYNTLGNIRLSQGRAADAVEMFQNALRHDPDNAAARSNLLMTLHYRSEFSADYLFETAQYWGTRLNSQQRCLPSPTNLPDPQRRLRVGYVSGDFHNHPVGFFIETVLAQHDKSRYEIFCYYNKEENDKLTTRLRQYADNWRNVTWQPDMEVARQIRQDGIDVLIDLSGHTDKNRLLVFALKPAPVQALWIGYHATTGLPAMDYIIADRFLIPPQEERYYVEKVVRLPHAYLCFSPPEYAIAPSPLPALAAGKVTFGCFNNNAKVTEAVIACWSRLLHALPGAQLYLKYKPYEDTKVRQRYLDLFAQQGIAPERVRLAGYSSRDQYLASYQEVDIALDPFPFNGCTTTAETLWMGVPVVTLRGDRYVSHMGETILKNIGMGEYVADSEEEYIAKALALASDLPRLAALRARLRGQLLNSPLCDGPGFTRDLEAAYRTMWGTWCQAQAQRHD